MSDLPRAIRSLCSELSAAHVEALAVRASGLGAWTPISATELVSSVPIPHQSRARVMTRAWEKAPNVDGAGLALALRSVLGVMSDPDAVRVDVVCTGPSSLSTPVRLTSEVVCQLIDHASSRLLVVSYASYKLARVLESLDAAVDRGIKVTLVLESPEKLKTSPTGPYDRFPVYLWPLDQRPANASLHAKAVVADGARALLTSANLTQAAYDANIELGVLISGGVAPRDIESHFLGLIQRRVLVPARL